VEKLIEHGGTEARRFLAFFLSVFVSLCSILNN